jgi:hypothetical protein
MPAALTKWKRAWRRERVGVNDSAVRQDSLQQHGSKRGDPRPKRVACEVKAVARVPMQRVPQQPFVPRDERPRSRRHAPVASSPKQALVMMRGRHLHNGDHVFQIK